MITAHNKQRAVRMLGVLFLAACMLPIAQAQSAVVPAAANTTAAETFAPPLSAATAERLMGFGRIWAFLKYHHPRLGYGDLDWDAAFVETVPGVLAATDRDTYATAVRALLAKLDDHVTRLDEPAVDVPPLPKPAADFAVAEADGILSVRLGTGSVASLTAKLEEAWPKIHATRLLILDLRGVAEPWIAQQLFNELGLDVGLVKTPTTGPAERWRQHRGYVSPRGSGGYYSAFVTSDGPVFRTSPKSADLRCVFLTRKAIPDVALALQAQGRAAIVVEGAFNENPFVRTMDWPLPEKLRATLRLTERVYPDGHAGIAPDVLLTAEQVTANAPVDEADRLARAWLRGEPLPTAPRLSRPATGAVPPEHAYSDTAYPNRPYRLLAAFRAWGIFEYFFPYKDLIGADWTGIVRQALPEIDAASDAEAYHLAIARLLAKTGDSHVWLNSPVLRTLQGSYAPPALLSLIEGVPVVTRTFSRPGENPSDDHLAVGDEIVTLEGQPWRERYDALASLSAASTPQSHANRLAFRLLLGPQDSTLKLGVRTADGSLRELKLRRTATYGDFPEERVGPVIRRVRPDIGYVDLGRLERAQVDAMFDELKDTRAIIFDMRGYPQSTGLGIGARLATRDNIPAALFDFPVVVPPLDEQGDWLHQEQLVQTIRRSSKPRYEGKTVLLINEQAISQAEHLGLWLRAANGTTFIGSPTQGADGTVTDFVLPGGINGSFTGQRVRWPDGRQFQRIGLLPDVPVTPTITGIRAGRDEVLDKAVEWLEVNP